jgi:pheromone a factor receptor
MQWLLLSRRRFKRLDLSRSGMSTAQFIRLLILAVILSASAAWSSIFQIVVNVRQHQGLGLWVSWDYVHADFWNIYQYPKAITPPFLLTFAWVFCMLAPCAGVLFFVLFGLSGEVLALLKRATGLTLKSPQNNNRLRNELPGMMIAWAGCE